MMKKMIEFEKGMIQRRPDKILDVARKVEKMRAFKSTGAFSSHALFHQRCRPKPMGGLPLISWAISRIPDTIHQLSPPSALMNVQTLMPNKGTTKDENMN